LLHGWTGPVRAAESPRPGAWPGDRALRRGDRRGDRPVPWQRGHGRRAAAVARPMAEGAHRSIPGSPHPRPGLDPARLAAARAWTDLATMADETLVLGSPRVGEIDRLRPWVDAVLERIPLQTTAVPPDERVVDQSAADRRDPTAMLRAKMGRSKPSPATSRSTASPRVGRWSSPRTIGPPPSLCRHPSNARQRTPSVAHCSPAA
jgi:hypothetical protein